MSTATVPPIESIKEQLTHPATREAFIAWFAGKYPTRKVYPFLTNPTLGLWQAFCQSEHGKALQAKAPLATDIVAPVVADITPRKAVVESTVPQIFEREPVTPARNSHKPTQAALFDILAQGLQEAGFKPQADVDTDRLERLAEMAAARMIEDMIARKRMVAPLAITINDKPPVVLDEQTPAWFPRALKLASARKNCLLIGPAGSGKSYGAKLIAKALGLPYTPISLSGGTDEGILIGWLLPVGEHGRFEYVASPFVYAYEHGGVALLDELDAADPNVLLVVNEALSNGHFPVPLRREAPIATRHPDFVCLAAANTHGHGADRVYVGRNQLDGATLSRFRMGQINVDYDEAMERTLYAEPVVQYGQRLRARCRAIQGWTRDVSTRDIATAHDLFRTGALGQLEIWYQFFADWSQVELGKVSVDLDHTNGRAVLR